MTTELILFTLRMASALTLLAFLAALFWVLWRDFQAVSSSGRKLEAQGRLVRMLEADRQYMPTNEAYTLMPLTSLGRAPSNTIVVDDTFASTEHALVALRNGHWWLEDRNSTNGTLLNGVAIDQAVIVTDGDIISIGQQHFRLEL